MNGYPATLPNAVNSTEVRQTHVEEQTTILDVIANDLSSLVGELENRLAQVIIPSGTLGKEPTQQPEPMLVPLAAHLRDVGRKFNISIDRLRQLHSAIEL